MGCCFSRPEGPNSPYPGRAPSASARAINVPAAASSQAGDESIASPTSPPSSRSRPRHHHHQQPLSQHINKPLRRHEWASRNRTWTRAALDRERTDFFDTRVTGRAEVWQTLHAALDVLWQADMAAHHAEASSATGGDDDDDDEDEDDEREPSLALATAQSILEAADITLPTGNLAQGAYDALGNYYPLPEWIVADPVNMGHDTVQHHHQQLGDAKADLTLETEEADLDDEAERRREEKGKAVASIENQISVKARLSENSHDVVITLGRGETVRSLVRKISEEAKIPRTTRIKIGYLGKILKDGSSLVAQGWKEGHVVNALMFDTR